MPAARGADHNRALGAFGETYACHALEKRGYRILGRNLRFSPGEIDIVAEESGELVFLEVKTRRQSRFAPPESAITRDRLNHLEGAAMAYMGDSVQPHRMEYVMIVIDANGHVVRCDVLPDVGLQQAD